MDKFIEKREVEFEEGQGVELLICERTEIGYKTVINDARLGMLYKNEVFQTLRKGQVIPGFIKKVREDGKIDVCLHKPGPEKVDAMSEKILEILTARGGSINVSDNSSPEVIYRLFGVSKKTYKKAIGALYKKRLIVIEDDSIKLSVEKET
ncbi:MAG: hypothetical protein C0402_08920 [Thermodesulfovibrio sp.]|nr:hypothetical protein [Thermodesulfovibrio sp.]